MGLSGPSFCDFILMNFITHNGCTGKDQSRFKMKNQNRKYAPAPHPSLIVFSTSQSCSLGSLEGKGLGLGFSQGHGSLLPSDGPGAANASARLRRGARPCSVRFLVCKWDHRPTLLKGRPWGLNVLEVICLTWTDTRLQNSPPGSIPHRLGANGMPTWRTWERRRLNLPRAAAPARVASLLRLREPAAPRGAPAALRVVSARAHRGPSRRASLEAGWE